MAVERDKAEWRRTASVIAMIANVNRADGKPEINPDQFSPYTCDNKGSAGKSKIKLTKENHHLLRALAK